MSSAHGAPRRPVLLVIMDGFGANPGKRNNAVIEASTPRFDDLFSRHPHTVLEATPDARLEPGHVYIAPGGQQFSIVRRGDGYRCVVERGERVNLHRPSVDVLFHSVAERVTPPL